MVVEEERGCGVKEERGRGGGGRPWRREVMEDKRGHGGGGMLWGRRRREVMEEEGGHGGDMLLGGAEESPLRGGNISHTSLERLPQKAGTRGGD